MTARMLKFVSEALATGLGVAYLTPFAKATLGSGVTVAIFAALHWGDVAITPTLPVAIAIIFFIGVYVSARLNLMKTRIRAGW